MSTALFKETGYPLGKKGSTLLNKHSGANVLHIQSTLVISISKGPSKILRDIRTSTYQICRIEEKIIRITTFNKYICTWTLEVRDILKILFPQYCLHDVRFSCLGRTRFSLRDKRLFEISEVEIARINCRLDPTFSREAKRFRQLPPTENVPIP